MLRTSHKECTGCSACVNICPKHAISPHPDKEGFLHPVVKADLCIDCNLCNKVCPVQFNCGKKEPLALYGLKNKSCAIRANSSSGGVFYELAERIINQGGIVYGARFDNNWNVFHAPVKAIDELDLLMKSKYVQSNLGSSFKDIAIYLNAGKKILFVGTPCQVSGLCGFLNKKQLENCITIELCCHGVPSHMIWSKYINEEFGESPIKSVNFRSKSNGWRNYSLEIEQENGCHYCVSKEEDAYMKGFLHGLFMRPACFNCPNKPFQSSADIVIGDFWGVDINHQSFNDGKGVSLTLIMTGKGMALMDEIRQAFEVISITWEDAISVNGNFTKSTPVSKLKRKKFWICLSLGLSVKRSVEFSLMSYPHRIIKRKLLKICKKLA